MTGKLWDSFRDELIASGLVLSLAVGVSFYFAHGWLSPDSKEEAPPPQPTQTVAQHAMAEMVKVLGEQSGASPEPTSVVAVTPSPSIGASPTQNPFDSEVAYGVGGLFDYDSYRLEIQNPRLVFDARESTKRKLVVDMVLYNKTIGEGITNKITASIMKDGTVIVPEAAMSVSETAFIKPQEKLSFQAKISLIESTDVKELFYKPTNQPPSIHTLLP